MDPFYYDKDGKIDPNYTPDWLVLPELAKFVIEHGEFPQSTVDFQPLAAYEEGTE